jgi:hypothetical protein
VVAGAAHADLEDVLVVGGAGVDLVEVGGREGDVELAVGLGDRGGCFEGALAVLLRVAVDDDGDGVAGLRAGVGDACGEVLTDRAGGRVVRVVRERHGGLGRGFFLGDADVVAGTAHADLEDVLVCRGTGADLVEVAGAGRDVELSVGVGDGLA